MDADPLLWYGLGAKSCFLSFCLNYNYDVPSLEMYTSGNGLIHQQSGDKQLLHHNVVSIFQSRPFHNKTILCCKPQPC